MLTSNSLSFIIFSLEINKESHVKYLLRNSLKFKYRFSSFLRKKWLMTCCLTKTFKSLENKMLEIKEFVKNLSGRLFIVGGAGIFFKISQILKYICNKLHFQV